MSSSPARGARKDHPFDDSTQPDFLDDVFDYNLPPKIRFDGPIVEYIEGQPVQFDPQAVKTRDIFITDTTFRDGQQARPRTASNRWSTSTTCSPNWAAREA